MDGVDYVYMSSSEQVIKDAEYKPCDINVVISSDDKIIDYDKNINIDVQTADDGKRIIVSHKGSDKVIYREMYSTNDNGKKILKEREFYGDNNEILYCEVFDYKNESGPKSYEKCNSIMKDAKGNIIGFRFYAKEQDGKTKVNENEYFTVSVGYKDKILSAKLLDFVNKCDCKKIFDGFVKSIIKELKPHELEGFDVIVSVFTLITEVFNDDTIIINDFCFQENVGNLLKIPSVNKFITKDIIKMYLENEKKVDTKGKTILIPISYEEHSSLLFYNDDKLYVIDSSGSHFNNSIYNIDHVNRVFKTDNLQRWGLCTYFTMKAIECMSQKKYFSDNYEQIDQMNLLINIIEKVGEYFDINMESEINCILEDYKGNVENFFKKFITNKFFNINNLLLMIEEFNNIERTNDLSIFNENTMDYIMVKYLYSDAKKYDEFVSLVSMIVNNNERIFCLIDKMGKIIKSYDLLVEKDVIKDYKVSQEIKKSLDNIKKSISVGFKKKYEEFLIINFGNNSIDDISVVREIFQIDDFDSRYIQIKSSFNEIHYSKCLKYIDYDTIKENIIKVFGQDAVEKIIGYFSNKVEQCNNIKSSLEYLCTYFLDNFFYKNETNIKNMIMDYFNNFLEYQEKMLKDFGNIKLNNMYFTKSKIPTIPINDVQCVNIIEMDLINNKIKIEIKIENEQKYKFNGKDKIEFDIKLKDNLFKDMNILNQDSVFVKNVCDMFIKLKNEKDVDYKNSIEKSLSNSNDELDKVVKLNTKEQVKK